MLIEVFNEVGGRSRPKGAFTAQGQAPSPKNPRVSFAGLLQEILEPIPLSERIAKRDRRLTSPQDRI
jgi:hypothetical protein